MIKFKDILNELEIKPSIPDPIKRKKLKIGDEIEWGYFGKQKYGKIKSIMYKYKDSSRLRTVKTWQKADFVIVYIGGYYYYCTYYKNPQEEYEQDRNKQFDSIQKINPINELEIQPNIDPIKNFLKKYKVGDKIEWINDICKKCKGEISKIKRIGSGYLSVGVNMYYTENEDCSHKSFSTLIYKDNPENENHQIWNKEFLSIKKV